MAQYIASQTLRSQSWISRNQRSHFMYKIQLDIRIPHTRTHRFCSEEWTIDRKPAKLSRAGFGIWAMAKLYRRRRRRRKRILTRDRKWIFPASSTFIPIAPTERSSNSAFCPLNLISSRSEGKIFFSSDLASLLSAQFSPSPRKWNFSYSWHCLSSSIAAAEERAKFDFVNSK